MNAYVAQVLGSFSIEFQQDVSTDRERHRSRSDLLERVRSAASLRRAKEQQASSLDGALSSGLGAAASIAGSGEQAFQSFEKDELAGVARGLNRADWGLSQASRFAEGLQDDRAEQARSEESVSSASAHAQFGLRRVEESIERQERLAAHLLDQLKKG